MQETLGPLSAKDRQFIRVCEVLGLETFLVARDRKGIGRRSKSRLKMAHAFIAKALWNIPDTKALIGQIKANITLRRLCGWEEGPGSVPDESTFCRAFATFARMGWASAHQELIATHWERRSFGAHRSTAPSLKCENVNKDPAPDKAESPPPARKRGQPRKGDALPRRAVSESCFLYLSRRKIS